MIVGYGRASTHEQGMEAQLAVLGARCERVYSDKLSGKKTDRAQLLACLEFVRAGDTLVITRLDRLARSVSQLCNITEELSRKGVDLVVLDQSIDTSTPTGRLLFHVLAAIAEFELGVRKEAQRAGIAHARAAGKRSGRAPCLSLGEARDLAQCWREGVSVAALGRRFRISRRTVYRYLAGADTPIGVPTEVGVAPFSELPWRQPLGVDAVGG